MALISPIIILVEPQLAENIGMVARAMANFGFEALRLVAPRDGWPNRKSIAASSGAHWILENALNYATLEEATKDCTLTFAMTARQHGQMKEVYHPKPAIQQALKSVSNNEKCAFVFGRERNGLESEEVGICDAIVTLPINPKFSSLNLAQAVILVCYEWVEAKAAGLPFETPVQSQPATKEQLYNFFERFEKALDEAGFFRPIEKREVMVLSLRNLFIRMKPTTHDLQTLSGAVAALRVNPKANDTLQTPEQADILREFLTQEITINHETKTPIKGLARLLRRNPRESERVLWSAMVKDARFQPLGFKRALPVGVYITDICSMKVKTLIEFEPTDDKREERHTWFEARGYKVIIITEKEIANDLEGAMAKILTR